MYVPVVVEIELARYVIAAGDTPDQPEMPEPE
jgi:hypothetical protein